MSKKSNFKNRSGKSFRREGQPRASNAAFVATLLAIAFISASCGSKRDAPGNQAQSPTQTGQPTNRSAPPVQSPGCAAALNISEGQSIETLDVNKAIMVTQELDFGPKVPAIAEALRDIERCYKADDGSGQRTFAVLDAYGEPTPDGKLLHISMHVSSEKPGLGALVFKRTGQVLWRGRINPTAEAPRQKNLMILIDAGGGRSLTVDGSGDPRSVLEARVKEMGVPVKDIWADGTEREVTFIYSACGCPVKTKVRRVGDKTARTSDTPVMFPDDPTAMRVISRLMGW